MPTAVQSVKSTPLHLTRGKASSEKKKGETKRGAWRRRGENVTCIGSNHLQRQKKPSRTDVGFPRAVNQCDDCIFGAAFAVGAAVGAIDGDGALVVPPKVRVFRISVCERRPEV